MQGSKFSQGRRNEMCDMNVKEGSEDCKNKDR